MNDPSIDNPRLLTLAGEEEHIAIEERRFFAGVEARVTAHYEQTAFGYRLVAARITPLRRV